MDNNKIHSRVHRARTLVIIALRVVVRRTAAPHAMHDHCENTQRRREHNIAAGHSRAHACDTEGVATRTCEARHLPQATQILVAGRDRVRMAASECAARASLSHQCCWVGT